MTEFHPLFPPSEDEDDEGEAPDIQAILIQRRENGKFVTAPGSFMPGDMNSLSRLYGEFGGGEYQLLARAGNGRIIRRILHTLPGPPKPMYDEAVQPKPQTPAQSGSMFSLMGQGGEGGVMGIIMMMMQNMMQQANQASERQTQMMLAMMTSAGNASQAQIIAMQENMRAQAERDQRDKQAQIELMLKLSEARGSGNSTGSEESFFKGVEFMRHFATTQLEAQKAAAGKGGGDFDLEGIIGTVLEALQGFNAFKEMSGAGGLPGAAAATEVVQ